jgi:predicted GNAT family acetyltransferase
MTAACYNGGNLIPVGGDAASWQALAAAAGRRARNCTSVVGRADAVRAMWAVLAPLWGEPRAMRERQPLLVTAEPAAVAGDESVRRATMSDLDRYLAAASTMFAEELGVSPRVSPGGVAFRNRVVDLITSGRALASFDFRGQIVFKADLGVITPHTCQIQGVWVRPDLRRRGLGTAAMASVLSHALGRAPTASLYVNDFNAAARRVYEKLGMREHAVLTTVLL